MYAVADGTARSTGIAYPIAVSTSYRVVDLADHRPSLERLSRRPAGPRQAWLALAVALALVVGAASPSEAIPSPSKRWTRLDSPNFTLFSSATERTTRSLARDLEELRAALKTLLPDAELHSPVPTWIYVFQHRVDFAPYRPIYDGRREEVDGYFLAHAHGNYVAIDGDARSDPRRTILHEYLHEVERRNLPGLPLWLAEGLAEVYSSFATRGSEAIVGLPHRNHGLLFRRQPLMPLAELLAIGRGDRDYHRGAQRDMFYAQSWALAHMLAIGGDYGDALKTYLRALAVGEDANEAFVRIVGDVDIVEMALRTYVRGRYPVLTLKRDEAAAEQALGSVQRLPYVEVLFRLGDLLAHGDAVQLDAAAKHFAVALETNPKHAPSIAGLGLLAERAGDPSQALRYYGQAAQADPNDARLAYLYGQGLLRSVGLAELAAGATTPEQHDTVLAARQALARSTLLAPDFGEAWVELGFTYSIEEVPSPDALVALERAHALLPERIDVAYNLFLVLTRLGERGPAEQLLATVIEPFAEPEVLVQAQRAMLGLDIAQVNRLLEAQRLEELEPLLERIAVSSAACASQNGLTPCPAESEAMAAQARQQLDQLRAVGLAARSTAETDGLYRQATRHAAAGEYAAAEKALDQLVALLEDGDERDEALELLAVVRSQRRPR